LFLLFCFQGRHIHTLTFNAKSHHLHSTKCYENNAL
jgi:hypothetical protein